MSNFLSSVLSKALVKTPRYSAFPQPNEVKYSGKIGLRYPVQRWIMNPGDSIDVRMEQLTRFAPLAAPMMHNFRTDFIAIEIPDRLAIPVPYNANGSIDGGFENFHNLDVNDVDRPVMPQITLDDYVYFLTQRSINPQGTLLDFLGYPTFSDLFRKVQSLATTISDVVDEEEEIGDVAAFPSEFSTGGTYQEYNFAISSEDSLITFLAKKAGFDGSTSWETALKALGLWNANYQRYVDETTVITGFDNIVFLEPLLRQLNLTSAEATRMWQDYLFSLALEDWMLNVYESSPGQGGAYPINDTPISLKPLYEYWTAVYDWFINTNIEHIESKVKFLLDKGLVLNPSPNWTPTKVDAITPAVALWNDDYFTSAFDVPANGGSIAIPSGTLQNLREASALDKLRIKVQYAGKRYIDQILALFGVHSSNERLDRCRVLGVAHFNQNVSDVTQTSQSNLESSLGDFAGKSISVGSKGSFIHYTAEEHSTIMVFACVRPVPVYESVMPKDLLKVSPYDYLIPGLDKVGEQAINPLEIYPSISKSAEDVFGFQRRYAEYMYSPSHIHGEFRTSLDFWHDARQFDSAPALNKQFVSVDVSQDNLNRIFAVPGAEESVYQFLYFDTVISRPLPKYVNYGF